MVPNKRVITSQPATAAATYRRSGGGNLPWPNRAEVPRIRCFSRLLGEGGQRAIFMAIRANRRPGIARWNLTHLADGGVPRARFAGWTFWLEKWSISSSAWLEWNGGSFFYRRYNLRRFCGLVKCDWIGKGPGSLNLWRDSVKYRFDVECQL